MLNINLKIKNIPYLSNFDRILKRKKRKSQKEILKKSFNFNYGEQDQIDLISYSGLEENSSYLQMGDKFVRTLFISGYPYVASSGWLNMLINFNHNIDISYHIEQVDPHLALPKLKRKITELESTKRSMLKDGKVLGSEITDPLESAMDLRDKIQRGQEKLFQISIYMTLLANSLDELNKVTTTLETVMSTRLFYIITATFQQWEDVNQRFREGKIYASKEEI